MKGLRYALMVIGLTLAGPVMAEAICPVPLVSNEQFARNNNGAIEMNHVKATDGVAWRVFYNTLVTRFGSEPPFPVDELVLYKITNGKNTAFTVSVHFRGCAITWFAISHDLALQLNGRDA